jgi:hypothetical protein
MAGDKDARITVGIEGADDVARAADRATAPWRRAGEAVAGSFRRAGQAISSQLEQVGMDMLRTVTVMRTLDMRSAVDGARSYREEVTRFGIVARESVGGVRLGFEQLSKMTLEGEPALVAWSRGVGRLTYDYTGAIVSAKALHDESVATGKSFDEMGQLGVVMHESLGVADQMDTALGKIRAQAEALGTVGGAAAFQDQILALGGALTGVATQSEQARSRVTALLGILGKGYSAPQAQQIQQSVFGGLLANANGLSLVLGHDVLNEKGELADPARTLREAQAFYQRLVPNKRLRRMMLRQQYGNLGGSAIERGDFSEQAVSTIAALPPSRRASRAAEQFEATDAGKALKTQLEAQRHMRDAAEALVGLQDKWGETFASSPLAGQVVGGLVQATMRTALGQLGGIVSGGATSAAGGAGGEAAVGGLTAGLGGATLALGAFTVGLLATGKVLSELGEASKVHQGFDTVALTPEKAKLLSEKAQAAEVAAPAQRSEGVKYAFELEQQRLRAGRAVGLVSAYEQAASEYGRTGGYHLRPGNSLLSATEGPNADPVLQAVRQGLESGRIDTRQLPHDIAAAIVEALQRSPLKAVIQAGPGGVQPPEKPDGGRN